MKLRRSFLLSAGIVLTQTVAAFMRPSSLPRKRWTFRRRLLTLNSSKEGGDDAIKKALDATKSIQFCYRSALVYVVVDSATTVYQNGGHFMYHFSGVDGLAPLVPSLAYLNFGVGLWYATREYSRALEEGNGLTMASFYGILQKMAYVWRSTALFIVAGSAIIMRSIQEFTNQDAWGYAGPLAVFILTIVGQIGLTVWSANVVKEEVGGPLSETPSSSSSTNTPSSSGIDATAARAMGFKAARNMAFCMGAYYLLGIARCFVTATQPVPLLARIFSISDIVTPVATAKLLGTLHSRFVAVVVESTKVGGKDDSVRLDTKRFFELTDAQSGLYRKIAQTINGNTVVGKIVPLVVGAVQTTKH